MKVSEILLIVGGLGSVLGTVIGILWKRGIAISKAKDNDKEKFFELTRSFVESQKDTQRLLENNTKAITDISRVMDKLPGQFELILKANHNRG